MASASVFFSNAWAVLLLFIIPIGGGIPGGVLLARNRGLGWPVMMVLYFISDALLAVVFEPMMHGLFSLGKKWPRLGAAMSAMGRAVRESALVYGNAGGPLALILISFSVDPMTGRAATAAAGHGFFSGWALSITGDMMYFTLLMVCTLWLNKITGDVTKTITIMLALMVFGPMIVKRLRRRKQPAT